LHEGTEENHEKSVRIAGVPGHIRTEHLLNTFGVTSVVGLPATNRRTRENCLKLYKFLCERCFIQCAIYCLLCNQGIIYAIRMLLVRHYALRMYTTEYSQTS
jgi:hypothetical protein